jgi:hypothetical protein
MGVDTKLDHHRCAIKQFMLTSIFTVKSVFKNSGYLLDITLLHSGFPHAVSLQDADYSLLVLDGSIFTP